MQLYNTDFISPSAPSVLLQHTCCPFICPHLPVPKFHHLPHRKSVNTAAFYRYLCLGLSTVSSDHITFVDRCVSRQSLGGTPSQFRKARPNELGSSKPKR